MSKFNQVDDITNKAGGKAYRLNTLDKLVTMILTSFFNEDKFYGDNSDDIVATIQEVISTNPEFVAKCALFAREEFYLRTISHVLAAELARHPKGKRYARRVIKRICQRPDDMTEILAYYLNTYGKPIPNSMKKGISDALRKFDEYQLAKYNRKQPVKLRDILRICHPAPKTKEQEALWGRVLSNTLATPYTWETELSARGNTKEVWSKLIASKRLPYMAALRNLRNIAQAAPDNYDDLLAYISNPQAVSRSKQLPFRFYAAYKALQDSVGVTSKTLDAIELALEASVDNLPLFDGKTVIMTDVSGSMFSPLSKNSRLEYIEVGALLSAIANRICNDSIIILFDNDAYPKSLSSHGGILANTEVILSHPHGGATYAYKAYQYLLDNNINVDRIITFSDMQCYTHTNGWFDPTTQEVATLYRQKVNPNVFIHSVDLAGYGTSEFNHHPKTNLVAGWSEKLLHYIKLFEQGTSSLRQQINNYI